MDENNGPTRVIPGSHRWGSIPPQKLKDLRASVEGEVLLTGSPGDVIFLNSHVWHGGTQNHSGDSRGIVQSYYVHRAHPAQQNQQAQIRQSSMRYLSKEDLKTLDVLVG